jgi:SET domain-containing protein
MIHIKYKIKESKTHGIGLFADHDIKAGDFIYTPSPLLDVDITQDQFDGLTSAEKKEVMYYGYFNKKTNKWHVAFDAIRILNHGAGEDSNVTQDENMVMTAKRDIPKGEELLQDYDEIYPRDVEHFARINKS